MLGSRSFGVSIQNEAAICVCENSLGVFSEATCRRLLRCGGVFNNVSDILILSSFVPLGLAYCASPCQAAANAARNFYALRTKLQYCSSAEQRRAVYMDEGTRTRDIAFYGKDVSLAITVY